MTMKKQTTLTQQEFLREAKDQLGLTWSAFAKRIGAPESTLKKWSSSAESEANFREMPSAAWALVREVLEHESLKNKFEQLKNKANKSA